MIPPRLEGRMLPIFPCYPTKRPACANGYGDASTDLRRIVELWAGRRSLLVAVPTGEVSGISVLDIDTAGMGWLDSAQLPPTREHQTRSGGRHLVYRHREGLRCSQGVIAAGVDVRGDGGYIIHWPSAGYPIVDRPVVDWPIGLVSDAGRSLRAEDCHLQPVVDDLPPNPGTILKEVTIWEIKGPKTAARWSREETFALYALNYAMQRLAKTPEGQRNHVLNGEAYALGRLVVRGWVGGDAVVLALGYGAECCGHVLDHGEAATIAVIRAGLLAGMGRPYPDLDGSDER